MASSYNISLGNGILLINADIQKSLNWLNVSSDSALNDVIVLKLQQSTDGLLFHDLPEAPIIADAGANSNLLQTESFIMGDLYLNIDVGSATLGTLNLVSGGK